MGYRYPCWIWLRLLLLLATNDGFGRHVAWFDWRIGVPWLIPWRRVGWSFLLLRRRLHNVTQLKGLSTGNRVGYDWLRNQLVSELERLAGRLQGATDWTKLWFNWIWPLSGVVYLESLDVGRRDNVIFILLIHDWAYGFNLSFFGEWSLRCLILVLDLTVVYVLLFLLWSSFI